MTLFPFIFATWKSIDNYIVYPVQLLYINNVEASFTNKACHMTPGKGDKDDTIMAVHFT